MAKKFEFYSFSNKGYEGQVIKVETDIRNGFPGFDIIGLPDAAIKESRERVHTALINCGFKFPQQKILVSLSPASVPKTGSLLDLGIALSILFACQNKADKENKTDSVKIMAAGELMLDGTIVQDYSAIGAIEAAKKIGCALCIIPLSEQISNGILKVSNLTDAFLKCGEFLNKDSTFILDSNKQEKNKPIVFSDIIGLDKEKEIITLCAAGRHSILLFGPPGVGKTMLCNRLIHLLQDLDTDSANAVQHIYGCAGLEKTDNRPPLRGITHDCSMAQFTGGQNSKTPGEGALAHGGILLLDEITSYTKKLLESVKETYDTGKTVTSRSGELISYPASFMMAATMNACPCGKLGSSEDACLCTSQKILSHWNKVGSPLLSRFDIRLPIEMQDLNKNLNSNKKPDAHYIDIVGIASERQKYRFREYPQVQFNGQTHISSFNALSVFSKDIEMYCNLFLHNQTFNTREILSIISVTRTIADTQDRDNIKSEDFEMAQSLKQYGTGDYYWRTIR